MVAPSSFTATPLGHHCHHSAPFYPFALPGVELAGPKTLEVFLQLLNSADAAGDQILVINSIFTGGFWSRKGRRKGLLLGRALSPLHPKNQAQGEPEGMSRVS